MSDHLEVAKLRTDQPMECTSSKSVPKRKRTPAKAYYDHKQQAKARDIRCNLPYAEWSDGNHSQKEIGGLYGI